MTKKIPIAIADGDGIGPEIMKATLAILEGADCPLEYFPCVIGEKLYLKGHATGIESATWDTIRSSKAFLKAPITTPQGGGFKSLNVTIRTTLGLYANVRPCVAYAPFIETKHPGMDVVIIRENEEDLYAGIEYRQTADTFHAIKIISRPGCERIVRYAFEYAKANGRKKVTCFTKDNIMKLSDGLFHKVFDELGAEYPDIEKEHWIVDIGAAKLADTPKVFDVVVMPNLYGDILSDVAAQIAGSVGLAGSANIGAYGAMFEAIHGSAPRRAGQNLANPSGLLLAAVMMLAHVGLPEKAALVHNAWLKTIEDGIHTYDIFHEGVSKQKVGTQEFAQAVIERLGQKPATFPEAHYGTIKNLDTNRLSLIDENQIKSLLGVDVFIGHKGSTQELEALLKKVTHPRFKLTLISNRGVKVWPDLAPETLCIDSFRARFMSSDETVTHSDIAELLQKLADQKIDFVKTEQLYAFDGKQAFS